jgi:FkbM family methyltransferase
MKKKEEPYIGEGECLKKILLKLFTQKPQRTDDCYTRSYSQSGEDVIVKFIFHCLGIECPTYIDIGANHPFFLNNTAIFYQNGSRGINIEPNPELFLLLQRYRPDDVNLNIGIAQQKGLMDFYLMSSPTMSTFSISEGQMLENETSINIKSVIQARVETLSNVINEYAYGIFPDFMSLDIEGLEEMIIQSIDYKNNFPKVICIETLTYTENNTEEKEIKMIDYLVDKGYLVFADTYINTIFVKNDIWKNRKR